MSTLEHRAKRLLSPESTNGENPEDKRLRANVSIVIDESDLPQPYMDPLELLEEEKEPTLRDIKRYIDTILVRVDKNGAQL